MIENLKVGEEVFACGPGLLRDDELEVRRYFLLEIDGRGWTHWGSSKKRESFDFNRRAGELSGLFRTPEEAVEDYKKRTAAADRERIADLRAEIARIEAVQAKIAKAKMKDVRVTKYAEDWTPCPY